MCPECRRGATPPSHPSTSSPSPMLLTDFNHLHSRSQNSLVYTASHEMTGAATFAHRAHRKKRKTRKRKEKPNWAKTKQAVDYFCLFFFFVSLLGISYVFGLLNGTCGMPLVPRPACHTPTAFRRKISYFVAASLRAGNMTCGMPCPSSLLLHSPLWLKQYVNNTRNYQLPLGWAGTPWTHD